MIQVIAKSKTFSCNAILPEENALALLNTIKDFFVNSKSPNIIRLEDFNNGSAFTKVSQNYNGKYSKDKLIVTTKKIS